MAHRKNTHWLAPRPSGLFIKGSNCWIDPSLPVEKALVTHGHSDHARGGHGTVVTTAETAAIMALRYGHFDNIVSAKLREPVALGDGVTATFYPAGHVLGSAQILLERQGERVVVTGEFKRRADPTCLPFELVPCDILITEATFGLPVFIHPPIEQEIGKLLRAHHMYPQRTLLVGAYALGKAQRVIAELRRGGYDRTIFIHGALERMCALYADFGVDLGPLRLIEERKGAELAGEIIICPPSALADRWSRRMADPLLAMASGWMRVRQRAVQRGIELPLIISDHADWNELTDTIQTLRPEETWVTHGRDDALVHWCEMHQLKARALDLHGYDEDDDG